MKKTSRSTLDKGASRLVRASTPTAAGVALVAVCYGLARFAYGLFTPVFRAEFELGAAAAGAIAASSYAAYCVAIVIATLLTPRLGGRSVAVSAGVVATIGTLLIALAPNAALLTLGVIVAGASTGVASPPLAHVVSQSVSAARRSRAQTFINAGTGLGVAIAGPVALLTHQHWRGAWFVFAIICAAVTVWNLAALPRRRRDTDATGVATFLPRPLAPPGSARLLLAALLLGAASAAVWTFGRDLLVSEGRQSEQASMVGWIVLGAFGALGAVAGELSRRFGTARAWSATLLALAAATALLATTPGDLVGASIALAVFGGAYVAATGVLLLWGTTVYATSPSTGVGLAFLFLAIGQALATPALGALSEIVGARLAFAGAAAVGIIAATCRPVVHTRNDDG